MPVHRISFYVLLMLLPTQLGYHLWPDWAFVLGRRLDYLSPTLYLTDITIVLTLIFWIGSSLNLLSSNGPRDHIRDFFTIHKKYIFKLTVSTVLFSAFAATNIYIADNAYAALYKWFKVAEYVLLTLYIGQTKPDHKVSIFLLALSGLYTATLGIWQFITGHSIGGLFWILGERTFNLNTPGIARMPLCIGQSCMMILRPYATLPHPNAFGGYLAFVILLIALQIIFPTHTQWRIKFFQFNKKRTVTLYTMILILCAIGLMISFSRTAWISESVMLLLIFFVKFTSSEKNVSGMRLAPYLAAVFTLVCLIGFSLYYISSSFISRIDSIEERLYLNNAAVTMWLDSPWFGVGLGNFLIKLPEYITVRTISFLQPVHSIYLLTISETGVLGFIALSVLFVCFIGSALCFKHRDRSKNGFYFAMMLWLMIGIFDHYPISVQQGQLVFCILSGFIYASKTGAV